MQFTAGEGDEPHAGFARERMGMELQPTEIESARSGADRREAQVHEFHLFALSDIAEGLAVEPLEGRVQR